MRGWLSRPISSRADHISLTYMAVTIAALTALRGFCEAFQLPIDAFRAGAGCIIVGVTALAVAETVWMLDLEDEQTG